MGAATWIALLLTHPLEFRTLLQFWMYHEQKRDIKALKEHPTSGWDRQSMRRCWEFLDMTSRSFSAVIKELDGDLARTVSCTLHISTLGAIPYNERRGTQPALRHGTLRVFSRFVARVVWQDTLPFFPHLNMEWLLIIQSR